MQIKYAILVFLFFISILQTNAQKVICTIKDSKSFDVLSYTSIFSNDYNINYVANENGEFEVDISLLPKVDSLNIARLGYERKKVSYKEFRKDTVIFLLQAIINKLQDVTVFSTKLTWGEIMFKALKTINLKSQTPFESDVYKTISIKKGNVEEVAFSLKGFGHDEGFDANQLINNRNLYSWFVYNKIDFLVKPSSIINDYNGSKLDADTYFETRVIKFLFPLSIKFYDYNLEGIEILGTDTVFKISAIPNSKYTFELKIVDRKLFSPFYEFLFAKKIYFINSRTYEFVRVEFDNLVKKNIGRNDHKFESSNGYCNFFTSNGSIHPLIISIKHNYRYNETNIQRSDITTFSNIKKCALSNSELISKYKLSDLKGVFPGRQSRQNSSLFSDTKAYMYVHGIKL